MGKLGLTCFLVGRIMTGLFYISRGLMHFSPRFRPSFTSVAEQSGVPAASLMVLLAGLLLITVGFCIIFGLFPKFSIYALLIFLVPATVIMHPFADAMFWIPTFEVVSRNWAILGSSLIWLAIPEPWPLSLDGYIRKRFLSAKDGSGKNKL